MTGYDGPERRQERLNLAEALDDVRSLQAAVVRLTEVATHMVPREEIEAKLYEQQTKRRQIVLTAVALTVILSVLILLNRSVIAQLERNTNEARQGTLCLIEQLAEHRTSSKAFFRDNAKAHGQPTHEGEGRTPPPVPTELKKSCQEFFPPHPPGPPQVTR